MRRLRCWWGGHDLVRHGGHYLFIAAHGFDGPYVVRQECRRCGALWESLTWGRVPPLAPKQPVVRWTRGFQEIESPDRRLGNLVTVR